ncbi:MAG: CatB-related O-acetyltransferase [Bacteroidetes bacterium]|nr:CatB-related O-acetyltransferase [Bacteroidota bacterium]
MSRLKLLLAKLVLRLIKYHDWRAYKEMLEKGMLEVGHGTYGLPKFDVYRNSEAKVVIGKYCSISKGVTFITGGIHPPEWVALFPIRDKLNVNIPYDGTPRTNGEIKIGNDVWLGTDVTILSGVQIGNGAIIASGAIVTRNIPDYAIAAGIPAKIIKYRFTPNQIEQLCKIQWWHWDYEKIKQEIKTLNGGHVNEFIKKHQ